MDYWESLPEHYDRMCTTELITKEQFHHPHLCKIEVANKNLV